MSQLYGLVDLVVEFCKRFKLYGMSLYDYLQWFWWGGVAFLLVWAFIGAWGVYRGGGSDE